MTVRPSSNTYRQTRDDNNSTVFLKVCLVSGRHIFVLHRFRICHTLSIVHTNKEMLNENKVTILAYKH